VVRIGPGRCAFALSHAEAQALGGVLSHLSAALHWGWEVKEPPDRPWVTVARSRNISASRRRGVHLVYHPDLVERSRRVVLEADSWRFHASKLAHARDCRRYNGLAMAGWLVLRFTWDQVMYQPAYVHDVLAKALALPDRKTRVRAAPA
jgi:very-short-patch-repair endonuclease